jgi:WD40 repeat protein
MGVRHPSPTHTMPVSPSIPWFIPVQAVGCAALGQLLVWEWRSESYVLKQQGHAHDIAAAAFSPDGALLATGADDRKVCSVPCTDLPPGLFPGLLSLMGEVGEQDSGHHAFMHTSI